MQLVTRIREVVLKHQPNGEVILFGSRARGDARPDSDWDVLVLIDEKTIPKQEEQKLRDALYELEVDTDSVISPLIHTKAAWEARAVMPLYRVIQQEGVRA